MKPKQDKPQTAAEFYDLAKEQQRRRAQILRETPEETSRRLAKKQAAYKKRESKTSEPIPPIQSAYINMIQSQKDISSAVAKFNSAKLDDSKMWLDNAIAQLESASAKIANHMEESK